MNTLLESIFETKTYHTSDGRPFRIISETGKNQCEFLQKIISAHQFTRTLEIGFAYGISALAITEAVARNKGRHTIIDKFEFSNWDGVGVDLLNQAGFGDFFEHHEAYCYVALPKLMFEGRKFDFAYIDSTKQFDWLLVDFFYIDKMLEKNGIIVFDDVTFPGIRKLLRLLTQFPGYRVYGVHPDSGRFSALRSIISLFNFTSKTQKMSNIKYLLRDLSLGINAHCVAIQKTEEDTRNWDWHKDF